MATKNLTALVFGATGLVGGELLNQLLADENYSEILVFTRKPNFKTEGKVKEIVCDFAKPETFVPHIKGDAVFCCLGTTMSKAKNLTAYKFVDYELPVLIAKAAKTNDVPVYCLVSSIGANASSKTFYLKTKGETETDVQKFGPMNAVIVRPSILYGNRKEFRLLEKIGIGVMKLIDPLMVGKSRKYRGIEAADVAKTMRILAYTASGVRVLESDEIQAFADVN